MVINGCDGTTSESGHANGQKEHMTRTNKNPICQKPVRLRVRRITWHETPTVKQTGTRGLSHSELAVVSVVLRLTHRRGDAYAWHPIWIIATAFDLSRSPLSWLWLYVPCFSFFFVICFKIIRKGFFCMWCSDGDLRCFGHLCRFVYVQYRKLLEIFVIINFLINIFININFLLKIINIIVNIYNILVSTNFKK